MKVTDSIVRFDLAFSLFCLKHRFNLPVARVSKEVSRTGDGHFYVMLAVFAWLLDEELGGVFVAAGLCAFLIELPVYWMLKNSFKRRRPQELSILVTAFITPSDRFSLPSGHTTAAFLMASIIAFFYPSFSVLAFSWACAIGAARILLGVHFFTDVVIGALLGLCCAELGIWFALEFVI
ncbi:phosphatase PAP2 family protein [Vibrio sp. RC27]